MKNHNAKGKALEKAKMGNKVNRGDKEFKERADRLMGEGTFRAFKAFKKHSK